MPKSVYAVGGHYSNLEIDVEDVADILLKIPTNIGEIPILCHVDFIQSPPKRFCNIVCENGNIHWDYFENIIHISNSSDTSQQSINFPDFQRNDMFNDELKHFMNCLKGKEEEMVSISEGVEVLKVCLAAKKSLQEGVVVNI